MRRGIRQVLIGALVLSGLTTAALGAGEVSFIVGRKVLPDALLDSAGVDRQPQLGVATSLDFDWPVTLALDLFRSSDDRTQQVSGSFPLTYRTDLETLELDVGVRKFWGETLRPFVGGGLSYVRLRGKQTMTGSLGPGADFSDTLVDDTDGAFGFWVNAGLFYRVMEGLHLGIDVRRSEADADVVPSGSSSGVELEGGGTQYGLVLGIHW